MDRLEFSSKVDLWLGASIGLSALAAIAAALYVISIQAPGRWMIAAFVGLLGGAFPLWILGSTRYALTGSELVARSGPFRWTIPIAEIRAVEPTRNPLSSPALSLDRLAISYGRGQSLMISPRDRTGFLAALDSRRARR